ncbi:polyisoprenoid-binding protein YceI [Chitinophaga skermanii]|uniref:Polyisoprenoid-binding protein YceI n=1 Tax=Chitinophaga skermanii TaxID=331697 RepID=A0A327QT80_9BACT|nr:YceI family protein [Chitinophaga skermanii]RAJ06623.1 polyisoprenoid-binding protein YceI [Chitinophaga skermanii]
MKRIALLAAGLLAFSAGAFAQNWTLDKAHSRLGFSIVHNSISNFEGNFKKFDIKLTSSKEDFSDAVVELKAEAASINTDNERRDGHLQNADFFDAPQFPDVIFKSTSFKKTGKNTYKISGDLTFHGVTKPVTLDGVLNGVITPKQKTLAGFTVKGKIKRSDFNFASGMPANMLSDEIEVVANAEFSKD